MQCARFPDGGKKSNAKARRHGVLLEFAVGTEEQQDVAPNGRNPGERDFLHLSL
jgi:hypothetical protein